MAMMAMLVATGVTEEVMALTVGMVVAVVAMEGVADEAAVGVAMEVVMDMDMKAIRTLWTSQTRPVSLL